MAVAPQQIINRLNEGIAHHKAGRLDRAEAVYKQLAPLGAKVPKLYELWGQLAEAQGRGEDAIRLFKQAWQLDPRAVAVACRIATLLISSGKIDDAEKTLRKVLQIDPKCPSAWNVLGHVLKLRGLGEEAITCHEKAIEIDPKFVPGWIHLGFSTGALGKNFHALKFHERALELDPTCATARFGRAQSLHKIYRIPEAIAEYEAYLRAQPRDLEARSNRLFALQNGDNVTREQLFAEHCAYGKLAPSGTATLPGYDYDPGRRLRVAILSPDLRTHSCAYFLEPLLKHMDPAQFELYLYHDHFHVDRMSMRLKSYAAVWRNFVGQSHDAVEKVIRADRPDVLIELSGHVGVLVRLPMVAKRLAPVQITYLGYPDTTGVPAIDYRFTDPIADPVGEADAFATEKLVRFSSVAWTYQPPVDAPAIEPPPCLSGAPITFGCFNSPTKFNDALYRMWARILAAVPDSRLLLKGRDFEEGGVRDYLLPRMQAAGIPLDRLELLPRTKLTAEHLAQYAKVDIALDTFPYNGTTTTCEALWMGRPVVTLRGDRHAARVGSSLLTAIGRERWVATKPEGYEALAAALANDVASMRQISATLRDATASSPLMNPPAQAALFWHAVQDCWRARCGSPR